MMSARKRQPGGNPGRLPNVQRVRRAHVEWVRERLSGRDWQIIEDVNRLRLLSGKQVERLCFTSLEGHSRSVVRGRALRRLVRWQVLVLLPRRIGGAPKGSAGAVYALGSAAGKLLWERHLGRGDDPRVRHTGAPTDRTLRHTIAVSSLYIGIVEQARAQGALVEVFETEPACWWPDGRGGYIKPDAYCVLSHANVRDHWWLEVDLATEHIPTVRRKLGVYVDFVASGQDGPRGIVPRVLLVAMTPQRRNALQSTISRMAPPADDVFVVRMHREIAAYVARRLRE